MNHIFSTIALVLILGIFGITFFVMSLDSGDLDDICSINNQTLIRTGNLWGCGNVSTGGSSVTNNYYTTSNESFNQSLTDSLYYSILNPSNFINSTPNIFNQNLNTSDNVAFNTGTFSSGILDNLGSSIVSLDTNVRELYDNTGAFVVNWETQARLWGGSDGMGNYYYWINFNDATMGDTSGVHIDWVNKILYASSVYPAINWGIDTAIQFPAYTSAGFLVNDASGIISSVLPSSTGSNSGTSICLDANNVLCPCGSCA